jgi:hypothetical protein
VVLEAAREGEGEGEEVQVEVVDGEETAMRRKEVSTRM